MSRQSRGEAREGMPEAVRLRLVESDIDDLASELHILNERLTKILWALVGLLISVTTACVLLAINAGVGAA